MGEEMEDEKKGEEIKKKVDNAWKEAAKSDAAQPGPKPAIEAPEASFGLFISGLMIEALISLGEVENPITKKKETNAVHAKFIIDTLDMLKAKTKNNLAKDEEQSLEAILYELRMLFVAKAGK